MSGPVSKPDSKREAQHDSEPESGGPSRGVLVALLVVVVLAAGGIWLANHIRASARLQDCVMSGRTNCAPVQ